MTFAFHVMLKPHGAECNQGCSYCYYQAKKVLYPAGDWCMSLVVLEEFTRQYIQCQDAPLITFTWQGGEPLLMELDFFRRALELQAKYARPGVRIENTLQTNGTLLDDEWCRFLADNHFLVGVSLDGPQEVQDRFRRDLHGQSTFLRVMKGVEALQRHAVEYNILSCVHAGNVYQPLKVYRFLRDGVGASYLQFIPVVPRPGTVNYRDNPYLKASPSFGNFLNTIFDEWLEHDIGKVFVQHFDTALAAWMGSPPGLCVHEKACGKALVLEFNGDLYSCDHFVEPAYLLGNIMTKDLPHMVSSPQQNAFGWRKEQLPEVCRTCRYLFACNGGCPKDRLVGDHGVNFLCESYKMFFEHVSLPVKRMAALLG